MGKYADIVVYDKNGQIALIAEVKNKPGTSGEWAAKMRRNIYAHNLLPQAQYFLLALPDQFYLWKGVNEFQNAIAPTEQINPKLFLQPYFEKSGVSPDNLTGESFELIVASWLRQILQADSPDELTSENEKWLIDSGLFDALTGGHLELEAAA